MRRISSHLTYANVMATLAVFGILAGGGAYAASKIGADDIADNAIRSRHIKEKAVRSKHVKDDSLKGTDIDESSLGGIGGGVMLATLRDMFAAGQGSAVYAPVGVSSPGGGFSVGLAPSRFIATDLRVELDSELSDPNASRYFTLRVNDSDTALACTIVTGEQGCSSGERVTVPAGSPVEIRTSIRNTTYTEDAAVGWRAITP